MPDLLIVVGTMLTAGVLGRVGELIWHLTRHRYGP